MDSNQQPGQFNPQQYDFIMNDPAKPKKSLFSFGGGQSNKLIMILLGLIGLIIVIVVGSLLLGGTQTVKDQLIDIAQEQNEIIRVAEIGQTTSTQSSTKQLAQTIKLVTATDQNNILGLKGVGKVNDKTLAQKQDVSIDQRLTAAEQNGEFDATFYTIIGQLLTTYQRDVRSAFDASNNAETRQTLSNTYENATLLLEAIPN